MKIFFITYPGKPIMRAVIGFANSYEELMEINNKRTHPYNYNKEQITEMELTPDIFGPGYIDGSSNFCDYPKMGHKII